MASRSNAAAETDALRGASAAAPRDDAKQRQRATWGVRAGVAAAVGVLVCMGVVVASGSTHQVRPSTLMQLRGTPGTQPEPLGRGDANAASTGAKDLKEMLLERFGVADQASPATGDSKQQLKGMLLKEFGVAESPEKQTENVGASFSLASDDPEDEALRKQLKLELRDKLMAAFMPSGETDASQNDWNWLHPAADSYSQLEGDARSDDVDVSDVLRHLHEQHASRTHALVDELYRVDAQYARTVGCFVRGVKQAHKLALSRGEYEDVVGWMNEKCETTEGAGVGDADEPTASPEATLDKAMSDHFDRLVGDFKAGHLDTQQSLAQAQAIRDKIASCVARAAENAADANGRVDEAKMGSSLDWVVTQCASIPSR